VKFCQNDDNNDEGSGIFVYETTAKLKQEKVAIAMQCNFEAG